MSWMNAYLRAAVIFLYFFVATVYVPNYVLRLGFVSDATAVVQDIVVLVIWGVALVAGVYLLRRFQRQGLI